MVEIPPDPKPKSPVPLGIGLTVAGILIWCGPALNLTWQKRRISEKLPSDLHGLNDTTNLAAQAAYRTLQDNLVNIVEANNQIIWMPALLLGALLLAIGVTLIVSHYITLDVVVSSGGDGNKAGIAAALRGPIVLIAFVALALWFMILTTFMPLLVTDPAKRFDKQLAELTAIKHGLEAETEALKRERTGHMKVLETLALNNAQSVLVGFRCKTGGDQFAIGWQDGGSQGPTGMLNPKADKMAAEHSLTVKGGGAWHTINVGHTRAGTTTPVLEVNVTDFGLATIILLDDENALYTLCNAPNDAAGEGASSAETALGTFPVSGSEGHNPPPTPPQDDLSIDALSKVVN